MAAAFVLPGKLNERITIFNGGKFLTNFSKLKVSYRNT
jgi:hypothetical protein